MYMLCMIYKCVFICTCTSFSLSQVLLKSIYIHYVMGDTLDNSSSSRLSVTPHSTTMEELLSELLIDLRFPLPGKPPVKRSFGPLKELTLVPLNIMETLPYTSDNTYRLLKAIGKNRNKHISGINISVEYYLFIYHFLH